jgi:hypothetical protein
MYDMSLFETAGHRRKRPTRRNPPTTAIVPEIRSEEPNMVSRIGTPNPSVTMLKNSKR